MKKINLKDLFPEYTVNCYIEVPEENCEAIISAMTKEVADIYVKFEQAESAYLRRLYSSKAHYSFDKGDGIEKETMSVNANQTSISKILKKSGGCCKSNVFNGG